MLSEFKNDKNVTETAKKLYRIYGEGVIIDLHGRFWFSKFRSRDTPMRNEPRQGHSSDLDQDALRELVECNPGKSI